MSQPPLKIKLAILGGLGGIVFGLGVALLAMGFKSGSALPVYGTLPSFTLTNQDGKTITLADLSGQVWIADTIFTRCPSQCLVMSGHMKQIQDALPLGETIRLVSFTTDPEFDQPAVLKKYAERFGAREGCWTFLTGPKTALHAVEVGGLKLPVLDKPANEREEAADLFIHSEKMVLLDQQGRIRGYYDGQDTGVVKQVLAAAQALTRE